MHTLPLMSEEVERLIEASIANNTPRPNCARKKTSTPSFNSSIRAQHLISPSSTNLAEPATLSLYDEACACSQTSRREPQHLLDYLRRAGAAMAEDAPPLSPAQIDQIVSTLRNSD